MYDRIRRALAGAALVVALSTAGAETAPPSKTYDIPVRRWLEDYVAYCDAHKLAPEVTFRSPSIWLFSPDGAMTALITVGDDPELATLKAAFPPDSVRQLDGKPSLAQARELLTKTLGADFAPKPVPGQWFAVLFLSSSPSCEHCATFDAGLAELEARAPTKLKVIRVRAMF
jgi:hypothetical protein